MVKLAPRFILGNSQKIKYQGQQQGIGVTTRDYPYIIIDRRGNPLWLPLLGILFFVSCLSTLLG